MNTRTYLKTNLSDLDWFRLSVDEARSDPVGLWEMVKVGRQGFDLGGKELEMFVRDFILEMLGSGAQAVVGDKKASFGWRPLTPCPGDPNAVAESLIANWRASKVDPNVDGVWFAFPSVFN